MLLKQVPFRPFQVRLSSGDVFEVNHPENASVVNHWVTLALPDGENAVMVSALHIAGISGVENIAA